jgi:uncharacterized protein (TIGR02145 family)
MIKKIFFAVLLILASFTFSQTVTIGSQVWMTKNLDVEKFRNGDPILEVKTNKKWKEAYENNQPAWCYYKNKKKNGKKYGKLYNWAAVIDPRGLAPVGYHIPTYAEWIVLTDYLGGDSIAGNKMKSTEGWTDDGNGTNLSEFSGFPGGSRSSFGYFGWKGKYGDWWSASEISASDATICNLSHKEVRVGWYFGLKGQGLSVRCIKD